MTSNDQHPSEPVDPRRFGQATPDAAAETTDGQLPAADRYSGAENPATREFGEVAPRPTAYDDAPSPHRAAFDDASLASHASQAWPEEPALRSDWELPGHFHDQAQSISGGTGGFDDSALPKADFGNAPFSAATTGHLPAPGIDAPTAETPASEATGAAPAAGATSQTPTAGVYPQDLNVTAQYTQGGYGAAGATGDEDEHVTEQLQRDTAEHPNYLGSSAEGYAGTSAAGYAGAPVAGYGDAPVGGFGYDAEGGYDDAPAAGYDSISAARYGDSPTAPSAADGDAGDPAPRYADAYPHDDGVRTEFVDDENAEGEYDDGEYTDADYNDGTVADGAYAEATTVDEDPTPTTVLPAAALAGVAAGAAVVTRTGGQEVPGETAAESAQATHPHRRAAQQAPVNYAKRRLIAVIALVIGLALIAFGVYRLFFAGGDTVETKPSVVPAATSTTQATATSATTAATSEQSATATSAQTTTEVQQTSAAATSAAAETTAAQANGEVDRSIQVTVLNNSTVQGLAASTAQKLSAKQWTSTNYGNLATTGEGFPRTVVLYDPSNAAAKTAAEQVATDLGVTAQARTAAQASLLDNARLLNGGSVGPVVVVTVSA